MLHKHRIKPGHMGGEYIEGNVISVAVIRCDKQTANHAMWHFANYQLWGKEEDRLAWKGLAGFLGKEEVIFEMMEIGRRRGRVSNAKTNRRLLENGEHNFQNPDIRQRALESSLKTNSEKIKQGEHPWQNPQFRAARAEIDRVKRKEEFENGTSPLQRPDAIKRRKAASSKSRSANNSKKVLCPHCGKVGGATNMARYHFDKCPHHDEKPI